MNKKIIIIGFLGVFFGVIGAIGYETLDKQITKSKNLKIIKKITDNCPIYGDGNKLDSLTFFSKDKELIFHYSFLDIQADSISNITPISISPLFLFSGFDTTFYSVLTQKERKILFNENYISSRIHSVDGRFIAIGKPGKLIELLPEIKQLFNESNIETNLQSDDIEMPNVSNSQ